MQVDKIIENKNYREFVPLGLGREDCEPGHSFGAIREIYIIHFVLDGCGIFKTGDKIFRLKKGDAFLIRPGEYTYYEADMEKPWTYMWIHFNGNLAKSFDSYDDVFKYDKSYADDLISAFSMEDGVEEYLTGMLFILHSSLFAGSSDNAFPKKVKNYIDINYMNDIKIEEIAKSLNLNRKYLSRIFKEKYGISMQQYLIKKRMHEAKKLLSSGYSVSETAFMTGYSDCFNFSNAFKKYYGESPIKFRL